MEGERIKLLLIGLGNPGLKYRNNRHNAGFMVLDRVAELLGVTFSESSRFRGAEAKGGTGAADFFLLKPKTYMNLSGQSVSSLMSYYRLTPEQIVVVTDDIATPFGELRLKASGSPGGHNGLKSIEESLGTRDYPRLKIGILGSGYSGRDLDEYVLNDFSKEEEAELPRVIECGAKALLRIATEGLEAVMNEVNIKVKKPPMKEAEPGKSQEPQISKGQENNNE